MPKPEQTIFCRLYLYNFYTITKSSIKNKLDINSNWFELYLQLLLSEAKNSFNVAVRLKNKFTYEFTRDTDKDTNNFFNLPISNLKIKDYKNYTYTEIFKINNTKVCIDGENIIDNDRDRDRRNKYYIKYIKYKQKYLNLKKVLSQKN